MSSQFIIANYYSSSNYNSFDLYTAISLSSYTKVLFPLFQKVKKCFIHNYLFLVTLNLLSKLFYSHFVCSFVNQTFPLLNLIFKKYYYL